MATSTRYLLIALGGALLFLPALGAVHLFDWDEINFAECAREMLVSKDYLRMQIDFRPFWEKPPLFIWLQALSMHLFGVNEYAARFPNALTGIATLLGLYHVGRRVASDRLALVWVVLYVASWLPHFYFKSGIIDPVFNLFIFAAFYQVHRLRYSPRKRLHATLAGLFLGLAVLTKGPVALLVSGLALVVYAVLNRGLRGYAVKHLLLLAGVAVAISCSWFAVEVARHGWDFVREFVVYQAGLFSQNIADHEEPWYYHPIVLLIGCFPASILVFNASLQAGRWLRGAAASAVLSRFGLEAPQTVSLDAARRDFTRWMWILFWVVLILFSIVKTKIVHYSSLCYFPLTYLAAVQVERLLSGEKPLQPRVRAGLLVVGCLWGVLLTALPLVGVYKARLIPFIEDPFAVGNLQAPVRWSIAECLWGLLYLAGIITALWLLRRSLVRGLGLLAAVQVLAIQATVLHFAPKIEAHSQRAAIEFFKARRGEDCYVQVLGYKSYAHLFYTAKTPPTNPNYYNESWLLHGPVDKPTYFVCKVDSKDGYVNDPALEVIGERGGFVFFRRR